METWDANAKKRKSRYLTPKLIRKEPIKQKVMHSFLKGKHVQLPGRLKKCIPGIHAGASIMAYLDKDKQVLSCIQSY